MYLKKNFVHNERLANTQPTLKVTILLTLTSASGVSGLHN